MHYAIPQFLGRCHLFRFYCTLHDRFMLILIYNLCHQKAICHCIPSACFVPLMALISTPHVILFEIFGSSSKVFLWRYCDKGKNCSSFRLMDIISEHQIWCVFELLFLYICKVLALIYMYITFSPKTYSGFSRNVSNLLKSLH